jgi:hypothetical protein
MRLTSARSASADGACIDPRRPTEIDAGFRVQDVAGQRDKDGAGGRRGRDLGGAAHDTGQIFKAGDLDCPFHQRFGDPDKRSVEQRLHQPVPLFLLSRRKDHRSAGELRIVERAHRISETRRDMHVAGDEAARCPTEAVRDRDHEALLHRHDVGKIRVVFERVHDRQFGRARISEQMSDALILQQSQKCRAAGDAVHARLRLIVRAT